MSEAESIDRRWSQWGAVWRTEESPAWSPASIQRAVEKQGAELRRTVVFELVVTITVWVVVLATYSHQPWARVRGWFWFALIHTSLIWGYALVNRRGMFDSSRSSTLEYLALGLERHRRQLAFIAFGMILSAVEAIGMAVWFGWTSARNSALIDGVNVAAFGGFWVVVGGALVVARRRTTRRLEDFQRLETLLSEGS